MSTHATSKELEGALRKSYSVIQQLKKQLADAEPRGHEPIAVVGMSCRFPGGADTPERYWDVLASEADTVREIPADRWPWQQFYNPDTKVAGTHYVRHGSFLDQVADFDPEFFGISGREADALDPQHRLLLEVSWEALERAGLAPQKLRHSQTGVYVGIGQNDYAQLRLFGGRPERISPYDGTGSSFCFSSARLSYVLGLHGPSMAIDTACSSGLVALHLACQALRNGECAQALAGGVQLVLSPEVTIYLSRIGALSPDGRSKSFSASADGYGRGEGCGMLVLKRLSDAQRDGDQILAVIPGSAVNHDGASSGLTVPNGLAQAQLLREALNRAGLEPHEVDWIEAHGTGTILGDPIELSALAEVFPTEGRDGRPLYVSSVKGNIGHLEAAAGIAGVIKVILALQHDAMPAQPRFDVPNPAFDWQHSPLVVPTALTAWDSGTHTAGVSAFGLGGTNAHVLLSRAPASSMVTPNASIDDASRPYPLVLSAKSPDALAALRDRYVEFLGHTELPFAAIAHTAAVRRNHFSDRVAVVAADARDAIAQLAALDLKPSSADAPAPRVAFIFSGQGAQYTAMGRHLYAAVPQFRDALDECAALIEQHAGWSPLPLIVGEDADPRLDQTEFTQPCLFALQYALVATWRAWGIEPHVVVGHSIGEYAAACTAGVMTLEDAARLVVQRGRLMQQTPVNGGMAALLMSEDEARSAIGANSGALTISAVNGPRAVVIAGATGALDTCLAELERNGRPFKRLAVSHAFHTPLMRPVLEQFSSAAAAVTLQKPRLLMVPTGVGAGETHTVAQAAYWTNQIVNPVRFADAIAAMAADAPTVVVEIGPSGSLLATARQSAGALDATWLASMKAGAATATFETLAQLYTHGCTVLWERVFSAVHPVVASPTYPFQRRRCWVDEGSTKAGGGDHWRSVSGHPFLGRHIPSPLAERIFTTRLSASSSPLLEDHRVQHEVVVPAACFVEAALAAAASELRTTSLRLTDVEFVRRLVLSGPGVELQTIVTTESGTCTIRISSLVDEAAGRWVEHMRCTAQALPEAAPLEPLSGSAEVESSLDGAQFYEESTSRGIEYGPSFQSLVRLHSHPGHHGSAEFEVPLGGGFADYRLHPVILDTALQALASTRPELGERTYIPAGIARLDVSGVAPMTGRVACRWEADSGRSAFCALSIADRSGVTSVRIDGIRMHEVSASEQPAADLHAPIWVPVWEPVAADVASAPKTGLWLVAGDIDGMGDAVVARLTERGQTARIVPLADMATVVAKESTAAGVCYLAVGAAPVDSSVLLGEALGLVQMLGTLPESRQPKLLFVTRSAHACDGTVDEAGATRAPLWGFARTVRNEYPGLRCACVDLDAVATDDECAVATVSECVADDEDQVAWRNNARFALRLRATERPSAQPGVPSNAPSSRLVCRSVGNLDSLEFEPAPLGTPGPGEVLVAVRAAGLNFKDVLHALGALALTAESDFGFDAAGIVTAVGDDVSTVRVGDRVMLTMTPGSMAQTVVSRADFVTRLPEVVTFAEGAGVPLAFLTAWHALVTLANVQPGERVLIHAATGGVGQAAVQVARMLGAEVLATASAPKQRVLREQGVRWIYGSRTTDFAAAILADTGGRGVDVVLNSLTGDMIRAGLECTTTGGRFVEIGKTGIWSAEQVAAERPDLRYLPFDLADVARANPVEIRQMLEAVASRLQSGELSPIRTQVFPARKVTDAFRLVSRARHVGKIAIEMPAAQRDPCAGVHVITGGFGALAQSLCGHLQTRGVRQIALVARAEPVGERLAWLEALRQGDVDVRYYVADVANESEVTRALAQMRAEFASPVVAVYHTAGELSDGIIAQQTPESFARVARAKLTGAWNLHRATRGLDLQRFVLFSSVAALVGTPGQSNYAAANAGLDALAAHRRTVGLPALSVNWGPWGGAGMAARLADADIQRMTAAGITVLDEAPAWAAMDALLKRDEPQAMVMPIDWSRFVARFGGRYVPSLFRGVQSAATQATAKPAPAAGSQLVRTITALPPRARRAAVSQYLQTRVAITLGRPGVTDIPLTRGFFSLGMDSLTSLELRNQLELELRTSLPPTVVLEYGSIEALSGYLLTQVPEWAVAATPAVTPTALPSVAQVDAVAALDELSEQELVDMLSRELEQH